jgi:hypothetical protein
MENIRGKNTGDKNTGDGSLYQHIFLNVLN